MSTRVVPVTVTRTLGATKNSDKEIIITYVDLQEFLGELNCNMEYQASLSEQSLENRDSSYNSLPEPRKPTKDQSGNWCYIFFGASIPVVSLATLDSHIRAFATSILGLPVNSLAAWLFLLGVVVVFLIMVFRVCRARSS